MGTAVDTVILQYFLLTDRFELLVELLDPPVVVPTIVFDPEEPEAGPAARSELARCIDYEDRAATAPEATAADRKNAERNATRLRAFAEHVRKGSIEVVDLDSSELQLLAEFRGHGSDTSELLVPLGMGEAACLAIAIERGYVLATDDSDALRVLERWAPGHPYERIRKLLIKGAEQGRISRAEADALHAEMRRLGFWDAQPPFGDLGA